MFLGSVDRCKMLQIHCLSGRKRTIRHQVMIVKRFCCLFTSPLFKFEPLRMAKKDGD